MKELILVINPGSTTTKIALFNQSSLLNEESITHSKEELEQFDSFNEQRAFREKVILNFMQKHHCSTDELLAVVGRGGLLKPIPGGTYVVDEAMLDDLRLEKYQSHASNLGAILAYDIAQAAHVQAYIVDPVVVDELQPIARISGFEGIERRSIAHVLNQKAVARKLMTSKGKLYENSNLIVAHLGGGISIGAHHKGRMIDVVNGLDGEGPFSTERTGALPLYPFAQKIITEDLSIAKVKKLTAGQGGLYSYLQETDLRKIEAGPAENLLYVDAMCYQIAKAIGEMAVVLKGQVDYIVLTGGMAHSTYVTNLVQAFVQWIAPVEIVPGQMEMEALFGGVKRVLNGLETAKNYQETAVEEVRETHGN